ncbi:TVP38/TMEM64 family protein [Marinobacter sp. C2H3]|uniref:TVP38/TMEM64 family protein n=1 Tax=Marinobacter sp. C2H3 TaxID=3119003 RepID=UPI00300EF8D2
MRRWLKPGVLVLGVVVVLVALAGNGDWSVIADRTRLAGYLHEHGALGYVTAILLGALYTGVGGPRQVLALACGFALGATVGTAMATLATLMGALLPFYTARWLLGPWLASRMGGRLRRFHQSVTRHPFSAILMIRLLPVGNNLVTNLLSGASGLRARPFLAGSALGYLPQTLVFALAGSGAGHAQSGSVAFGGLLVALSLAVAWGLRALLRRAAPEAVLEEAAGAAPGSDPTSDLRSGFDADLNATLNSGLDSGLTHRRPH